MKIKDRIAKYFDNIHKKKLNLEQEMTIVHEK